MRPRCHAFALAGILAALAPATPSGAQQSSATASAGIGAAIVPSLSVQKAQDMILGEFRPGESFGTVDVDVIESNGSLASSRSASGGVSLAGSAFSAAQFSVAGPPGTVHFTVALPSSIKIQRTGGSETMTVDRFRANIGSDCAPGAPAGSCPDSPYTLLVGATLHVDPKQAAGRYVGTFTVTVNQL